MLTFKIMLLGLLMALLSSSCTTHQSPRQNSAGTKFLFVTDDEKGVFRTVFDVVSETKRDKPIFDLDGPVRGYGLKWVVWLDRYDSYARVYRASGEAEDGKRYNGYYVEVSGSGTLILRGPALDKQIYDNVNAKLSSKYKKINVHSLDRKEYLLQRDRWRLNDKPSLRDGGSLNITIDNKLLKNDVPVEERLSKIEELRKNGTINDSEYSLIRKQILESL